MPLFTERHPLPDSRENISLAMDLNSESNLSDGIANSNRKNQEDLISVLFTEDILERFATHEKVVNIHQLSNTIKHQSQIRVPNIVKEMVEGHAYNFCVRAFCHANSAIDGLFLDYPGLARDIEAEFFEKVPELAISMRQQKKEHTGRWKFPQQTEEFYIPLVYYGALLKGGYFKSAVESLIKDEIKELIPAKRGSDGEDALTHCQI